MSDVRLKISPPWVLYIKKLEALFDGDPQIAFNVNYGSDDPYVGLATSNPEKAAALVKLLTEEVKFGNVVLKIVVDCPTIANLAFATPRELFDTAFNGNPAYAYSVSPAQDNVWYVDFTYVVFKNYVVQFFADNLNDPHGVISTLYQDIAEEIFEGVKFNGGVAYCTDIEHGSLGKPLGEWP